MNGSGSPYLGKYRGTVENNVDPDLRGRIQVSVPDVSGFNPSNWALPCAPVAGPRTGLFAVPMKGSQVWVEFEQGDIGHPIWVGCFWGEGEAPPAAVTLAPGTAIVLQTPLLNSLVISDGPEGGIAIRTTGGASLVVSDKGITIDNGRNARIELTGLTVSINGDALEVT